MWYVVSFAELKKHLIFFVLFLLCFEFLLQMRSVWWSTSWPRESLVLYSLASDMRSHAPLTSVSFYARTILSVTTTSIYTWTAPLLLRT